MAAHWESALLNPEFAQLLTMMLAGIAVGGVVYVLVIPYVSGERKASQRVGNVARGMPGRTAVSGSLQIRKGRVQETLKNIEAKKKPKKHVPLRIRLIRSGLSLKPRGYYLLNLAAGVLGGFIVLVTGSSLLVSLLAAFACGFGLPRWIVARLTKRRQAKFLVEFANSIDIIVRGIKSGLALSDCMQIIATESPEPVRGEFVHLIEQQKVGVPLADAFERMYERVPLQEVNFFAIVIAIQNQIGGNLAEVLSNLAQVLRDRYRVQAKVQAFSAEAKASAAIIGALPPLVILAMYLTSPDYISILWHDKLGNLMLIGSGIWMAMGVLVMRKMINFDY
jgi:tight adherence protein B